MESGRGEGAECLLIEVRERRGGGGEGWIWRCTPKSRRLCGFVGPPTARGLN